MTPFPDLTLTEADAFASREGETALAWERFDRWLRWWRENNEDDERDDLALIDFYAEWSKENDT
jgi:hypothetical protein